MSASASFPTGATLARAVAVARWLNWVWMAAIVAVASTRRVDSIRDDDPTGPGTALRQPVVAWLCILAVLAMCVWGTQLVRSRSVNGLSPTFAIIEASLALAISAADGWVFDPGHVFETSQSLAAQYPLLAAATVGLTFGPWVGAAFGAFVGPFEWWGAALNNFGDFALRHWFSIVATSVFFALAGAVFGWLGRLLRRVETTIADQRARDEVANVLHDTVLQTLAVVEQRSAVTDPELAANAKRADRELRSFLFGAAAHDADDLEGRVRHAVERAQRDQAHRGSEVEVVTNVLDLGSNTSPQQEDALAGAIGEAVTNAIKHARASRIVVFVETLDNGTIEASVKDDGDGFDADHVDASRHGISGSIVKRLAAVGGGARIESRRGAGTDVRLWVR